MAVPTVDAITVTPGNAASPGAITGTLPSGSGDLLIAFVMYDNVLVSAPGWTVHDSRIVGGTADVGVTMLSAPSNVSSLTFTPTDTGRAGVVVIYRISGAAGVHAAAGIGALGNTTSTTRAIPTVTTTVNDCLLISGVGSDGAGTNYTWDSPWVEQTDDGVTGDTGLRCSTATATQVTAGTTPGGNVTLDVSDHHGISMVAIEPGSSGLSASVGLATESDASLGLFPPGGVNAGQAAEADSANPHTRNKSRIMKMAKRVN